MNKWLVVPFIIQGFFIFWDEYFFHYRRELPKWERIGHPLDTLTFATCIFFICLSPFSILHLRWYIGLSIFSCLFITKDEWVHRRLCSGGEMWTHSILFLIHPICLACAAILWFSYPNQLWLFQVLGVLLLIFALYQYISANIFYEKLHINNSLYDDLGERWYTAQNDPVALLRAESKLFEEWISDELGKKFGKNDIKILDVGCGGGLLSNALSKRGWNITGIDLSDESLKIARKYDVTKSVSYELMDATRILFPNDSFDVVVCLDMLEHVEDPNQVISECARVLKANGQFFFHTFNRTFLGWLFAVKGLEWFVQNTPKNLHVHRLFIKPSEIEKYCQRANLKVSDIRGVNPRFSAKSAAQLFFKGTIAEGVSFGFSENKNIGYAGQAVKS